MKSIGKKRVVVAVCLGLALTSLCFWEYSASAAAEKPLIRFHVIANSDSDIDQAVKLEVRDAVLQGYSRELSACADYAEACDFLKDHSDDIQSLAGKTLELYGFDYGAKVEIGQDLFPTKSYGDMVLAAGEYKAVKIILGAGEGKNWWCVMFPPLCFVDISQNVGIAKLESTPAGDDDGVVAASGGVASVKIKSKLGELFQ
ncbi:MAG: stage II sporulation protein R [Bacillota bacterium]|nr:stage II sporulation protein R [Bacillota bacterium]